MINEVRNSVLTILNKNNYGYLSPSDFNLLAANAQMELYEEYYSNYNKTINAENMRSSGTDYADINKPMAEVLENFLMSDFIVPKTPASTFLTNNFYYPSIVTTGSSTYMINKLIVYTKLIIKDNVTSVALRQCICANVNFFTLGIKIGDVIVNTTTFQSSIVSAIQNATSLYIDDDIFTTEDDEFAIYSSTTYSEAEKVSNSKILMLQNSLLTAPSLIYPAYSNIGDAISLYPTSIQGYGAVKADYFRHPKTPKWTYTSLSGGEPIFDQSQNDYQDFELPAEDGYKLVTKMLEYCGIVIREIEVSQFGTAQQQHEQPSFSMQQ